jgi:phage baseplate assembly protein W
MNDKSKAFLGRGWKFPVGVDPVSGQISMSAYEQDIRESIRIILLTAPGERVMRPDFGCGAHDLVFASISRVTIGLVESRVRECLTKFEPRIEIVSLVVSADNADHGQLIVNLNYRVRETNNEFNLVFPFFLKEGTRV